MQRVSARNEHGTIVFSGIEQKVISNDPTDAMITRNQSSQHETILIPERRSRAVRNLVQNAEEVVHNGNDEDDNEDHTDSSENDDDGPNERGTYSKQYTLRHPEITWIHRGQGRYLPESALDGAAIEPPQSQSSNANDQRATRQSLRRRRISSTSLDGVDDDQNGRNHRRSPHADRPIDSPYSFRRRQSLHSQAGSDTRDSRASRRRLNQSLTIGSQSSLGDNDYIEDGRTYPKSYVEAHPEVKFKHCGNGFYRKLSPVDDASQTDQTPTPSQSYNLREQRTSTRTRQRLSRRASGASLTSTSSHITASDSPDQSEGSNMESLTKQQMLEYQARHPDVQFIHRGNGRYKRIDDIKIQVAQQAAMDPEDRITYTKEYVEAHPEQEFHHCGYGRYKRGPKIAQPNNVSSNEAGQEIPDGLVTKEYVDAHPEFTFHHRGQGRYALGPRVKGLSNGAGSPDLSFADLDVAPKHSKDKLYDREYVDAHPDETFHHRGQGRWAKGLPPPGSSNKMAVRGPGIAMTRTSTTSSATEVQYNEDELPGPSELVTKAEGPDIFRDIAWYYRGGGKWARTSRADQMAYEGATRTSSRTKGAPDSASSPALSQDYSTSRRGSQQSSTPLPTLKRKHSALQQPNVDDDRELQEQTISLSQRPKILSIDEDYILDEDVPNLYKPQWPRPTEEERDDKVLSFMRENYNALADPDEYVQFMTKNDISTRPMETLIKIAAHVQSALKRIQDEYLDLDTITAPQARIPRKVATGGRLPVAKMIFEDRKEADLYDYQFDPKRIGYQDPDTQKITRDADGRELRKRRRRGDLDTEGVLDEPPLPRRVIKPVNRFDGVPGSTSRKSKAAEANKQGSVTPDRITTSRTLHSDSPTVPKTGRWAGHISKRIKELRRGSGLARNYAATDSADDDDSE